MPPKPTSAGKAAVKAAPPGLDSGKPPMVQVRAMFQDLLSRLDMAPLVGDGTPVTLNVATLCSGTDAPIFGLQQIREAGHELGCGALVSFDHLYSCEIEPYKQGFLRRNMEDGTIIFRDVVEMANAIMDAEADPEGGPAEAMTAGGYRAEIPTKKLDILFCGCSCVDYSTLSKNGRKKADKDLANVMNKDVGEGDEAEADSDDDADDDAVAAVVNNSAERVSLDNHMNNGRNLPASARMEDIRLNKSFVDSIRTFIRKLQLDGGHSGESCRTFFAALMLIIKHRPKTIILENVFGAPWLLYTLRIFPRIGYYAQFVRIDSKDYYIPQTRQRGYLVAVDVTANTPGCPRGEGITKAMAEQIADLWTKLIKDAERRASSPASSFLRSPEDPVIIQARADMEGNMSAARSASWAMSTIRHDRERDAILATGDPRYARQPNPFSDKVVRDERVVYAKFPDFAWLQFWKKQVVRCVDLVDIRLALGLASGNDIRFRPYMLDISQNVDRSPASTSKRAGIVGCITPKGQPIVTDLMRPVTGFEALALQGMPVEDLVISTESQAQLHNLAGNAMTVTVVGAATLALLVSVCEHSPRLFRRGAPPRANSDSFLLAVDGENLVRGDGRLPVCGDGRLPVRGEQTEHGGPSVRGEPIVHGELFGDLPALSAVAAGGRRVCFCQYSSPVLEARGPEQVCVRCGHTACATCGGNSRHEYAPLPAADQPRCSSTKVRVELLKRLPMSFVVKVPGDTLHQLETLLATVPAECAGRKSSTECAETYRAVVQDVLGGDANYYFDGIKITEDVTVCYKAENSIARLVLSGTSVTMYIYLDPAHPQRESLRKAASSGTRGMYLDIDYQPIARVVFSERGKISDPPEWSVWIHGMVSLEMDASMDANGTITTRGISFAGSPVEERAHELVKWKSDVDDQVSHSVFEPLRHCGTPLDELRVKKTASGSPPVFFMRHCDQATGPEDDPWVWTTNNKKLESHEYRETLVQFRSAKPLTKTSTKGKGKANATKGKDEVLEVPDFMSGPSDTTIAAFFPGYWARFPHGTAPEARKTTYSTISWAGTHFLDTASCHRSGAKNTIPLAQIFVAPLPRFPAPPGQLRAITHSPFPEGFPGDRHLLKIPTTQRDSFLHLFAFAASDFQLTHVPSSATPVHLLGHWITIAPCNACTLAPPKVNHHLGNAYELRSEAWNYEMNLRALPVPITLAARQSERGTQIDVHLAPKVLVSRALSHLLQAHPQARSDVEGGAVTKLRVELDYAPPESEGVMFKPLIENVKPCSPTNLLGLHKERIGALPGQPPRFVERKRQLRESQLEAVRWMIAREVAAAKYLECEMEEDVVRGLNLRVVGKAEWANGFPYSPRGGVVGHEIGYGKTVVMLGLIDHRRKFDGGESIRERREEMEKLWWRGDGDKPMKTSFHHLKATLVIVPAHITAQWRNEAIKFLGLIHPKVLVIAKLQDLESIKLAVLKAAEIIILSKAVFQSSDFSKQLDIFSTTGRLAKLAKGRELEHLHETAMSAMRRLMAQYLGLIADGMSDREATKKVNRDAGRMLDDVEVKKEYLYSELPTDSSRDDNKRSNKRIRVGNGKAVRASKGCDDGDGALPHKPPPRTTTIHWTSTNWLQNFSFARIIWDEFSYEDENLNLFFQMAMANAKYLLSATPTLATLKDVCDVAKKFRVHVARPEPQMMPGLPKVTQGPVQDRMTMCEEFRAFSSGVKSVDMAVHRHEQAEKFVQAWFRSNQLDDGQAVDVEEMIVASEMSPQNAARYHLAEQDVEDAFGVYAHIPLHIRQETPIHKSDVQSIGGEELCMAMLVHLASGVGRETESIDTFVNGVRRKVELQERQWKALVDKLMWQYDVLERLVKGDVVDQAYDQLKGSMMTFLDRWSAPGRTGNYGPFGGPEMYARDLAILLGRPRQIRDERRLPPFTFSLPTALPTDWPERYPVHMALFTWIDFWTLPVKDVKEEEEESDALVERPGNVVKINPSLPGRVVEKLLADISTVLVKMDASVDPLNLCRTNDPRLDKALDLATREFRTIPYNIKELRGSISARIHELSSVEAERLVILAAAHKPARPKPPRGGGKADHGLGEGISAWDPLPALKDKKLLVTETRQMFGQVLRKEKALATARRALRFSRRLGEVFTLGQGVDQLCDECGREFVAPGMSFLIVACGHRVCHECNANMHQSCGVEQCGEFTLGRAVLRCAGPGIRSGGTVERWNKAGLIAELVGKIPKEDFIVIFAQYQAILSAIRLELLRQGVSLTFLTASVTEASAQLEDFKAGKGGRVLLIDIGSDHSAGSNITIANHVIFAHPYISTDPGKHLRVMRQAAGRCVRQGQEKKVKLYHFMTRNTIEERILRKRAEEDAGFAALFESSHVPTPWWLDNPTAVYRPRLVLRKHRPQPAPHPRARYQAGDPLVIDQ